jgi:hypothetical protein
MSGRALIALGVLGGMGLVAGAVALGAGTADGESGASASSRDVEALARMLASENPRGSVKLWVEQCWTQIHTRGRGHSVYDRITGGQGYGSQGGRRPVSTSEPAGERHRIVARLVLLGASLATWPAARRFFEPDQQDQMAALGAIARGKRAKGEKLSPQEQRALAYTRDAAGVRAKWTKEGSLFLGAIDGVEFWS